MVHRILITAFLAAFAAVSPAMSGVDRLSSGATVYPMLAGSYTSTAMSTDRLYAARSGGVDWVYQSDVYLDQWTAVQILPIDYLSITGALDGTLYGVVAGSGIDWIHWSGQWLTTRIAAGSYVSVAINTDPASGGLFAAGAVGGIDRIYWDGVQWTKSNAARGKYLCVAPDTTNLGSLFAVRSDGQICWIHNGGSWTTTLLIGGSYVGVASDTTNTGGCYALRSDGTVDRIAFSDGVWTASTVTTGAYKAITADLTNPGGLFGAALDAGKTIADAKKCIDNTHVQCTGLVTGYFSGYFYVAPSDRVSGIRVALDKHKAVEGFSVNLTGSMVTLPTGERCIRATSCDLLLDHKLLPFWMANRGIGGGAFGEVMMGAGQAGVANGTGLNNVGTLIKSGGVVTTKEGSDTITLTDGSGTPVKCIDPWGFVGYSVAVADYVLVTGVVSVDRDVNGYIVPTVILTDWSIARRP